MKPTRPVCRVQKCRYILPKESSCYRTASAQCHHHCGRHGGIADDEILGKPKDEADAISILQKLSGRVHRVVTGVCMQQGDKQVSFSTVTEVHFRKLNDVQIQHYVSNYKPFDKAGAYAIQEWIGMMGIEKIDGDYYNVMGLPIGEVAIRLRKDFNLLH